MRSALHGAVAAQHPPELVPVDRRRTPSARAPRSSAGRGRAASRPSLSACGTIMSTNFWRRSSLLNRLMPQAIDCSVWPPLAAASPVSGGPNIISAGHHQRSAASWAMARWASVPAHEGPEDLEALPLVEGLLLADPDHRARVRAVGAPAQRHLVHDRGAVDQPADRAAVGPGQRRVVEDRGVLLLAGVQQVEQLRAVDAEGLGGRVEVEPVAGLVLHLGHEDGLAPQRRGPGDPVALGLHADDLGVRVLGDLADQRLAVGLGHLVAGLDPLVGGDERVEGGRTVAASEPARPRRGLDVTGSAAFRAGPGPRSRCRTCRQYADVLHVSILPPRCHTGGGCEDGAVARPRAPRTRRPRASSTTTAAAGPGPVADASVRRARPNDAPAIGLVQATVFREAYAGALARRGRRPLRARAFARGWRTLLATPPGGAPAARRLRGRPGRRPRRHRPVAGPGRRHRRR